MLLMTKHCDAPGIESFSDKVDEASDARLPRSLRSHVTFKSPAVYIYTSGTTGTGAAAYICSFLTFDSSQTSLSFYLVLVASCCFSGLPKAAVVNQNRLLTALAILSSNGVTPSDVIYLNLPLYHTAGFLIGFIGSIETGELRRLSCGEETVATSGVLEIPCRWTNSFLK